MEHVSGQMARIVKYKRLSDRCPACDFFDEIDPKMRKRFSGQFDALTKMGAAYCNHERFTPLHDAGKPLWEFKEHDHRLYCLRQVTRNVINVILFNGWIKEKRGRTEREKREIERAKSLYKEFLEEYDGGNI